MFVVCVARFSETLTIAALNVGSTFVRYIGFKRVFQTVCRVLIV